MGTKSWVLVLMLVLASPAWAQTPPCLELRWEYDPMEELGMFKIYVRRGGQPYHFHEPALMVVPAQPTMVTRLSCDRLGLSIPGTYYLVATAFLTDGSEESKPSNEIRVEVKVPDGIPIAPPSPPPAGTPPPSAPPPASPLPDVVALPPKPPPLAPPWPKPAPTVIPPKAPSAGGGLTDHCIWTGRCR